MNGKKVIFIFLVLTISAGVLLSMWIKQGYDSRPHIQIEEQSK